MEEPAGAAHRADALLVVEVGALVAAAALQESDDDYWIMPSRDLDTDWSMHLEEVDDGHVETSDHADVGAAWLVTPSSRVKVNMTHGLLKSKWFR